MRNVGGTLVHEFQGFCLQHKTKEFLIWFSFKDDGFAVEAIIKKDFIWREMLKSRITKDESVVHISNVFDKKVVVSQDLFEIDGPNLFADGHMMKLFDQ